MEKLSEHQTVRQPDGPDLVIWSFHDSDWKGVQAISRGSPETRNK